jgi:hypothetical protein
MAGSGVNDFPHALAGALHTMRAPAAAPAVSPVVPSVSHPDAEEQEEEDFATSHGKMMHHLNLAKSYAGDNRGMLARHITRALHHGAKLGKNAGAESDIGGSQEYGR